MKSKRFDHLSNDDRALLALALALSFVDNAAVKELIEKAINEIYDGFSVTISIVNDDEPDPRKKLYSEPPKKRGAVKKKRGK